MKMPQKLDMSHLKECTDQFVRPASDSCNVFGGGEGVAVLTEESAFQHLTAARDDADRQLPVGSNMQGLPSSVRSPIFHSQGFAGCDKAGQFRASTVVLSLALV
jgi:hypothetical protein